MKRIYLLMLACTLCTATLFARSVKVGDPMTHRDRWVKAMFSKGTYPFSFKLDGQSSDEFLSKWSRKLKAVPSNKEDEMRYELTLARPDGGMTLRCDIVTFTDFPAVEWTLHFTNTSAENSPRLTDVKVADLRFTHKGKTDYTLYTAQGCHAIDRDFHLLKQEVLPDSTYTYIPTGGRPSSKTAFPFYNIATGAGQGAFFSIGWTGSWMAEFNLNKAGDLCLRSGMLTTDLFLYPNESIRTPLVSVLFWQGEDRQVGNNEFRRFVLAHHSPRVASGELLTPPLCSGFDYGDPSPCGEYEAFTEKFAAAVIERHQLFKLMPEIFWLDAGWYQGCNAPESRFEGRSWYTTVGSWEADPVRFPNGLKAIADMVHEAGAEFMVWFEPERVYEGSTWHREHPEWLLSLKDNKHHLLDLGNPKALDFLCNYMGDFFERNGIDHYRQDFNINPQAFWEAADKEGRKGMTEIRYVEGLYKYWDYLRERFPNMLIDNCSSGGRRFDLEMISRSIPLWRTDCHYGEPTGQQCHEYGLSQFLPLHGTGIYYADKYCSRSGLSSAYAWFGEVFDRQNTVPDMRHTLAIYKDLRNYFLCDFYPLSGDEDITGKNKWLAWQFHDRKDNSGIVQAFRRDEAPQVEMVYVLRGLDKAVRYEVFNEDDNTTVIYSGEELMNGLTIRLEKQRSSVLLRYKLAK